MSIAFFIIEGILILILAVLLVLRNIDNQGLRDALEQHVNELAELDKKVRCLNFANDSAQQEIKRLKGALEDEGRYLLQVPRGRRLFQKSHDFDVEMLEILKFPDIQAAKEVFLHATREMVQDDALFNTYVKWQMRTYAEDPMRRCMEVKFFMNKVD